MNKKRNSDLLFVLTKIMLIIVIAFLFMMLSLVIYSKLDVNLSPPADYNSEKDKFSFSSEQCVMEAWCLDDNTVEMKGRNCVIKAYDCINGEQCYRGSCTNLNSDCADECSHSGERECSGAGYKICGNFDPDTCLEWSEDASCLSGEICSDGKCVS